MSYVPLWCKSNFSFLEGAAHPEELIATAAEYRLPAFAITDRDGLYGVVRAHRCALDHGVKLILGAEITLACSNAGGLQTAEGGAHRAGRHTRGAGARVVLYAQNRAGYANLSRLITRGRLRAAKGESELTLEEVCEHAEGLLAMSPDSCTRFEASTLIDPLEPRRLECLREAFGDRLHLGIARYRLPHDNERCADRLRLARRLELTPCVAPEVLYHDRRRRRLQDAVTAIRYNTVLREAPELLRPNAEHVLLPAGEAAERYVNEPQALAHTVELADRVQFSLSELRYRYPSERLPNGYTSAEWLGELAYRGARRRYPAGIPAEVSAQLRRELAIIEELDYPGYFLTMWEIVQFCRRQGILCQGRGSAANSAVCYCLGITAVDPVRMQLLFERFLSRERAEPPDIDLDIEHHRREEVIQHVYETYGRDHAAMVANLVRYRPKSAIRDLGKALGIESSTIERIVKFLGYRAESIESALDQAGCDRSIPVFRHLGELAVELLHVPRHLSVHPGGFLLGSEPVYTLVPIENATMPDRTVIQWDKDDIDALGLFKVDLLGLGALSQLRYGFELIHRHLGRGLSMTKIPTNDDGVFAMLQRADTVGVFQLESRAQMAMLPRLRPRRFYDLVIEISIVRPGPITGGMVHPYLRRRNGEEPVVYPHESLRPVLEKTLGVPIFQEQVMKLAVVAADYTPGEADRLRRDMAAWRQRGRIERHHDRFVERMVSKGIARRFAEQVFEQIRGFGEYGFPESHAASFALIAYCTAYLRRYYPAVFVCALLNAYPMGFYHPATIVEDARRGGVEVRPVCVLASDWDCTLEACTSVRDHGDGGLAVRIGLRYVKGIGEDEWRALREARSPLLAGTPTAGTSGDDSPIDLEEFLRAAALSVDARSALAEAGAFARFGYERREALWHSYRALERPGQPAASTESDPVVAGLLAYEADQPLFQRLSRFEEVSWDYEITGHSTAGHPLEQYREELQAAGFPESGSLAELRNGSRVRYAGMVICRQQPSTAGGTVFMTMEDEHGFVNLIFRKPVFQHYRALVLTRSFFAVEGKIQAQGGVVHILVEQCFLPPVRAATASPRPETEPKSRDFC